jgi:Xaa-Pro aminopeptidase
MSTVERLSALRKVMKDQGIDAWICPASDPHSSEYQAPHWQSRSWLSGFNGSAGTVVVLLDQAGLWTDGRYHIQAATQLEGTGIDLYKAGLPGVPKLHDWLATTLPQGSVVGFDGQVFSAAQVREMKKSFELNSLALKTDVDLFSDIWTDRPALPSEPIIEHAVSFAGKSRAVKLSEVRDYMTEKGADYLLLSSLDDIAWLYNFRGSDLPCCPIAISYALVTKDEAHFYIDQSKIPAALKENFTKDGIAVSGYDQVFEVVSKIPAESTILLNSKTINVVLDSMIDDKCRKIDEINITTRMKAIKNDIEVEHFKNSLKRDGSYVVKFMKWLEDNVGKSDVSELSAADYLESLRATDPEFHGLSFTTIPGFREHGALMHYSSTPATDVKIEEGGFFLVDSGALYSDGTTDITRTFSYGDLSPREIRDYTLVLKGHINLARAVFLNGTRGLQLDILARGPMWREDIDYKCGTGHGVGFFLNVHEGPHNISPHFIDEAILPGMVVTNEPGIYREGEYGIRIENIMLCQQKGKSEFGSFNDFDTITMCPIETRSIDSSLLSPEEIEWLNTYHQQVFESLSPLLDEEHVAYLKEKTKAI